MTATYSLAPVPKWYIADLVGKPLAGGYLATFSSLDQTSIKLVYQDNAGTEPWPYVTIPNVGSLGILFDENGSQGPFYFQFDPATPDDLYYLEVYDANGVLQWTIDDFSPVSASGGSIITTANNLTNQIINNVFWRSYYPTTTPVAPGVFFQMAPGAHAGLTNYASNPSGFYTGPDIVFLKSNNNATDTVQFPFFLPLGINALSGDVTPIQYFNYTCSNVGAGGETQKCVQFPICRSVQNLSNQPVVLRFWARSTGITSTITLYWLQFFGNGGSPSANVSTPIQTITLTDTWKAYNITTTVPSVVGKTLGSCNNDALFLQFQYPLSALCNIDFVKPSLYLGNIAPTVDFQTYDAIDSLINTPRTGQIKPSYDISSLYGWVAMNDGTIGQVGSGATTYGGPDVFPLYNLLYQNVTVPSGNTICVVNSFTGDAVNDFTAGNLMQIPKSLGRVLGKSGLASGSGVTTWLLGQAGGTQTPSIQLTNLPDHNHLSPAGTSFVTNVTVGAGQYANGSTGGINGITGNVNRGGAQSGFDVTQPSMFTNFFIKL